MPQDLTVRDMQPEDIPAASRIVCASFQWAAQRQGFTHQEVDLYILTRGSEDAIRTQSREYRSFVACKGKQIVGMLAIKRNEITKLYVDPSFHGHGTGKRLFRTAEKIVKDNGHNALIAWAAFDSAITFYEAMGMFAVGRKFDIVGHAKGRNTMLMSKSLEQPA